MSSKGYLGNIAQALGTTSSVLGQELVADDPPDLSVSESLTKFAARAG